MAAQSASYGEDLGSIVEAVAQEKGIDKQVLIETMEAAILTPSEREKTRTAIANAPEAVRDELDAIPLSVATFRQSGPQPDVPVVIISGAHASDSEKFREAWEQLQGRLAAAYPRATRIVATQSGHYVPFDQPEMVVDAIREVVEKARAKPAR